MNDCNRRGVIRVCDYHRRGILSAAEACQKILFCVEPPLIADYMQLLPGNLRSEVVGYLPLLPTTDREWVGYEGTGMLDGDEWAWAEMIAEFRAAAEAARSHFFGGTGGARAAADFTDRVRAEYRDRMERFRRSIEDGGDTVGRGD